MSFAKAIIRSWNPIPRQAQGVPDRVVEYTCEGVKISFSRILLDETVMAVNVSDDGKTGTSGIFERSECRQFARVLLDNGFHKA
jgi:hypothetical protein